MMRIQVVLARQLIIAIQDIKSTLSIGLISTVKKRVASLVKRSDAIKSRLEGYRDVPANVKSEIRAEVTSHLNIEIRLYSTTPTALIMGFSQCLFTEQYHLGRPEGLVAFGGCLGKHIPVIQYDYMSKGFAFMKSHFEHEWARARHYTEEIIERALQ